MPSGYVCLTFDFDAVSSWIYRGHASPAGLSRGEFGVTAVPRILHMLSARDLRSTWFIPGHTIDTFPDQCARVVAAGHEVALHGYLHEPVGTLDESEERAVFHRAYDTVSRLLGARPLGNRTPSWDFSPYTVDIMSELGLLYDSSLMSTDYSPYFCRRGTGVASNGSFLPGEQVNLVELPVSWSLDDYPHFEYARRGDSILPGLRAAAHVFANFMDDILYMVRDFSDGVAVVTFHPQVIGRGHRLLHLERWIDALRDTDIEFTTCAHIARQVREGRVFGTYTPHTEPDPTHGGR